MYKVIVYVYNKCNNINSFISNFRPRGHTRLELYN